jgi:hypothetical protein
MSVSAITSRLTTTKKKADTLQQPVEPLLADMPRLAGVVVADDVVVFKLQDQRTISFPINWSAKLLAATPAQRQRIDVSDFHAFWDDIDEIIGVRNVLYGHRLIVPPKP